MADRQTERGRESGGQTDRGKETDRRRKQREVKTETEMAQPVANGSSQFAALVFGLALFSVLRSGPVTLQ